MSHPFDPYYAWLGIAPAEQPPDYYRLLGIERFEDDAKVISASADRQLAFVRAWRQGPQAAAAEKLLAELTAARTCLLDPARRADYDAMLRSRLDAANPAGRKIARPAPRPEAPPPNVAPPPGPAGTAGGAPPGYGPPGLLPQGPPPGPPLAQPPAPPVSSPPPVTRGALPQIATGSEVRIDPTAAEPSRDEDDEESIRQRQVWLLLATVAVVVVGAGLALAVVALGINAPRDNPGGNGTKTSPAMTDHLVEQLSDGSIYFAAVDAVIHGDTPTRVTVDGRSVITNWRSSHDWIAWDFRVERPAMFQVELVYAASSGHGGRFSLALGDKVKEAAVRDTGGAESFAPHEIGFMTVRRPGRYRLELRAIQGPNGQLMNLRAIRFTPENIGYVR